MYWAAKFIPYWGKSNVDGIIILMVGLSILFLYASYYLFSADKPDVILTRNGISYKPINKIGDSEFIAWSDMHSCWIRESRRDGVEIKLNEAMNLKTNGTIFSLSNDRLIITSKLLCIRKMKLYSLISDGIYGKLFKNV